MVAHSVICHICTRTTFLDFRREVKTLFLQYQYFLDLYLTLFAVANWRTMLYLYYKVFYSFELTCLEAGKFVWKISDPYNALIGT